MKPLYPALMCLALAGVLFSVSAQGADPLTANTPAQAPRPGDKPLAPPQNADADTASAARQALAQTVNDALTENKFPVLIQHLAKPDRDRIGPMEGEKYDDLNKAIAHFREDFRSKYHQEFDLKTEQLKDMTINFGLDKKAVTASMADGADTKAPPTSLPAAAAPTGSQDKDIASSTGLNVVNGPMLNLVLEGRPAAGVPEAGIWKIDIANEITGKQLKDNLTRHLQKLDDQKSIWPADVNAAYRAAASQVFQAFNDSTLASDR